MPPSLTFLLAATLLAITPGPGIAYVVARTVAGGHGEGVASCLGTALGGLVHVVAAALGLSLLLMQSAVAFALVKYVGAAYLVYMGLKLLLARDDPGADGQPAPALRAQGARRALLDGVLVEALNVKTALFFLAFLPQFVQAPEAQPLHLGVAAQFALLGGICVLLNTTADLLAVAAAQRLVRSGPARALRARLLRKASGTTMLGLGVYVALGQAEN
jgi:threonine/homoserine/homoserine lactone efflux protein